MDREPVRGTRITEGRPIRQFKAGRTCRAQGCEVLLSRYNPGKFCARHLDKAPIVQYRAS